MPVFSVNVANYDEQGYVAVSFAGMSQQSVSWYYWRIYRRKVGEVSWNLLHQYHTSQSSYIYYDYEADPNVAQDWVVVEVTSPDGGQTLVEGSYDPISRTPVGASYWLIHPTDSSLSLSLGKVSGDSFSESVQEEQFLVMGKGRRVHKGTAWGRSGTFTVKFRDKPGLTAREQRDKFTALKNATTHLTLRTPFEDALKVCLFGGVSYEREAGVGLKEFVIANIQYKEVA